MMSCMRIPCKPHTCAYAFLCTWAHTHSELSTAGSSGPLSTIIAKNIEKAIQLFNMKCDELILTTRDSLQVSGPPNHSQLRNITIVNTLHCFHAAVIQVRTRMHAQSLCYRLCLCVTGANNDLYVYTVTITYNYFHVI